MQSTIYPVTKQYEHNRLCILRDQKIKGEYVVCIISSKGDLHTFKMVNETLKELETVKTCAEDNFVVSEPKNKWIFEKMETHAGKYKSIHSIIEWNAFLILDDDSLSSMTLIGGVIKFSHNLINTIDTLSGSPFTINEISYFRLSFMFKTESGKLYGHNPYGRIIASGDWVNSRDPVLVETLPENVGLIKKVIDLDNLLIVVDHNNNVYYQELVKADIIDPIMKIDLAISRALKGALPTSDKLYEDLKHLQDDNGTTHEEKVKGAKETFSEIFGQYYEKIGWKRMFDNQMILDIFPCGKRHIIVVNHDSHQFIAKMNHFPSRQPIVSELSTISAGLSTIIKVHKTESHETFFIDKKGKLWRINNIDDKHIVEGFDINVFFVDIFPNYTGSIQASVILLDDHDDLWHFTTLGKKFECTKLSPMFKCIKELSSILLQTQEFTDEELQKLTLIEQHTDGLSGIVHSNLDTTGSIISNTSKYDKTCDIETLDKGSDSCGEEYN